MEEYILAPVESRFADIVWKFAPISTAQLIKACEEELCWKRTTTYTVLKKLSDRGIFENKDGIVTPLISRVEFYARQSEKYVEKSFSGSLPGFLAAFTSRKKLNEKEIQELKNIIKHMESK